MTLVRPCFRENPEKHVPEQMLLFADLCYSQVRSPSPSDSDMKSSFIINRRTKNITTHGDGFHRVLRSGKICLVVATPRQVCDHLFMYSLLPLFLMPQLCRVSYLRVQDEIPLFQKLPVVVEELLQDFCEL